MKSSTREGGFCLCRRGFNRRVFWVSTAGFLVYGRSGFWLMGDQIWEKRVIWFLVDVRSNLREMCDRIRFVSPLVCPRREGQLVRPRVRQGLKPTFRTPNWHIRGLRG
ncbi:hypothetical protein NDI47_25645 [Microcoleus vaginatus GB1-A2]|uniref:hypothetical protein n=1 Tax=Microcoleus vaginatus TaxID=119532 RepID=UPI001683AF29|nr:hypothetical protein [Microcoleus sp. FACHB-61]